MNVSLRALTVAMAFAGTLHVSSAVAGSANPDPFANLHIERASPAGSYLAGRYATRNRDTEIAARYIARSLQYDPNNPLLIERAFTLELSSGNIEAAEKFATRILTFNDQHRLSLLVLGLKAVREGKQELARQHFRKAAYTPIGELTSAMLSAWSYADQKNYSGAMEELDKLKRNQAFENFRLFHAALIADATGDRTRADVNYRRAYEKAGTSLRLVQAFGSFLERSGRPEQAVEIYKQFLSKTQRNPLVKAARERATKSAAAARLIKDARAGMAEALYSIGSAVNSERSIDIALIYVRLALSARSDFPEANTLMGQIYADMKQHEQAIRSYEKVDAGSALFSSAEIQTATNLNQLGRFEEAVKKLKGLVAREPGNYQGLIALGNLYRLNEKWLDAADAYTQALARVDEPGRAQWLVYYYRGIAYERAGRWANAEPDFRRALSFQPEQAGVLNYLGYSLIEKRLNLDEAFKMVEKAVSLRPNDGYIVDSLGWAHYQLGNYEEAVELLERAAGLRPEDPVINAHLGDALWRVGRRLEAKFQWQFALDSKPTDEDAAKIREKLKNGLPDAEAKDPLPTADGESKPKKS